MVQISEEDKKKIALVREVYQKFHTQMQAIEKERDEKIAEILRGIDERNMEKIRQEINNS